MTSIVPRVSAYAHEVARVSFIALGFSIPISVAMDGVLSGLIVLAWLAAAQFRQAGETIRTNPVAAFAFLWFFAHLIGALYSIGDAPEIQRTVSKAAMFLLIPVGITLMKNPADRDRALYAFMAAIAVTTVLSCLRGAGAIPADAPLLKGAVFSAGVVFKYHLTQNLLLALGAFVFAVYAGRAHRPRWRILFAGLSTLAALDVLVIGDGRTGQIVLLLLLLYYGAWRFGRRGFGLALCVGLLIGAAAYVLPDTAMHKRAALAMTEAEKWEPGIAAAKPSSVGDRLEFYNRSLHIVATHPLIGVGSGGFIAAYENEVRGTGLTPTHNPHNEYLLRAVELGIPGLVLLVALFGVTWRTAGRLSDPDHTAIARALVITFAVASLGSSTLNDHTESLLFIWTSGVLFAGLRGDTDVGRSTTTVVRLEHASRH